ncbi:hypothetical protein [Alkalimarinus sediminis]|uniref:Uncharacterized protein n=1 Tax=Alkalimarinus sediminis TaxID=1632866 RepID=A0A9E8HKF3_9ALTE|nr:hypothetical protein [Alkalimarinus sediminis]UZW75970.1 hypothetical protein NNL22_05145 [Alkalimarinus sediminis]
MKDISQYVEIEQIYAQTLGNGYRSLSIVSPGVGSGCTSIASALAFRHAAVGQTVLLVDANLRSPSIDRRFNLNRSRWPSEVPALSTHLQQVAPSIHALTANLDGAVEIKANEYLYELTSHFKEMFDVIIFDTSPLNAVNRNNIPAETIASQTEATLMIVKGGETTEADLRQAHAKLLNKANLVGAVINDQNNPRLADELIREADRLSRLLPRVANKLKAFIAQNNFLNMAT